MNNKDSVFFSWILESNKMRCSLTKEINNIRNYKRWWHQKRKLSVPVRFSCRNNVWNFLPIWGGDLKMLRCKLRHQTLVREKSTTCKDGPQKLSKVLNIDEGEIQQHFGDLVRGTVEETVNKLFRCRSRSALQCCLLWAQKGAKEYACKTWPT